MATNGWRRAAVAVVVGALVTTMPGGAAAVAAPVPPRDGVAAVIATAVMRAVQSGRLDLDVPITTYVPGFTVHSAFESHPEQRITLRMLLSHTAGLTHEAPLGNNYEPEPGLTKHWGIGAFRAVPVDQAAGYDPDCETGVA